MSLVFKATLSDLDYTKDGEARKAKASTCKIVLLAYADHANDEGEAAYPGYDKLEVKTALSRQGISDTLEALRQNEFLICDGKSKLETNAYHINLDALRELVKPLDSEKKDESSHLTGKSQATGLGRVKPLDLNHPLTIPQPSIAAKTSKPKKRGDLLDGYVELNLKHKAEQDAIEGMCNRIECLLGVRPNFGNPKWETVIRALLKRQDAGQPIESYAAWVQANRYDAPKVAQIANNPAIITDTWPAAFSSQPSPNANLAAYQPFTPRDDSRCVPPPERTAK